MSESMPKIESLNPRDLIEWCKQRKHTLGLSNMKLAELSGVPIGTIDRIFAGKYTEFRYSTIQPILSILIGHEESTPVPDETDESQREYYYETIEGYKIIVDNKNHIIEELKSTLEKYIDQFNYLKVENDLKGESIRHYIEHIKWLEKAIDEKKL